MIIVHKIGRTVSKNQQPPKQQVLGGCVTSEAFLSAHIFFKRADIGVVMRDGLSLRRVGV
jgi:hypothetical protein